MKKVYQTITTLPNGNCMEACIASLLEIELSEVPSFGKEESWYDNCQIFLAQYDLQLLCYVSDTTSEMRNLLLGYYIGAFPSPNTEGIDHAVIMKDSKVVHDPNPTGKPVDLSTQKTLEFLVKRCEYNYENPI